MSLFLTPLNGYKKEGAQDIQKRDHRSIARGFASLARDLSCRDVHLSRFGRNVVSPGAIFLSPVY
jgi:hypothetical protein